MDTSRYMEAAEAVAEAVVDRIIGTPLVHAECAHEPEHGVVCVWSASTTEQLAATVAAGLADQAERELRELRKAYTLLRIGVTKLVLLDSYPATTGSDIEAGIQELAPVVKKARELAGDPRSYETCLEQHAQNKTEEW